MKSKLIALVCLIGLISSIASAEVVGKIGAMSKDKSHVLVDVSAGQTLTAGNHVRVGDFCQLKVVKVKGDKALAISNACGDTSALTIGATVSDSSNMGATSQDLSNQENAAPEMGATTGLQNAWMVGAFLNDLNLSASAAGFTISGSDSQGLGLRLQYAYVSDEKVGFLGTLPIAFKIGGNTGSYYYVRPEASLAFAPISSALVYAGINFVKYLDSADSALSPSVGYQVGGLFKATSSAAFTLEYVDQKSTDSGISVDMKGVELGANYIF